MVKFFLLLGKNDSNKRREYFPFQPANFETREFSSAFSALFLIFSELSPILSLAIYVPSDENKIPSDVFKIPREEKEIPREGI